MKIFDSNKDKKWTGRGINVSDSSFVILKSAKFHHSINLQKGNYDLKIIGKKRTGDGKVIVTITDDDGFIYFKEGLLFNKNTWSELSFNFDVKKYSGLCKIEISRDRNIYGSVEVGRLVLDLKEEPVVRNDKATRVKNAKKLSTTSLIKTNRVQHINELNVKFEFKKSIAFIVPYQIYGGAEIYLENIINHTKNENYKISILYMKENQLQNKISLKGVDHRVVKNLEQLSGILKSNNYDYVVYYNRADIYEALLALKTTNTISSKLIEIYHSNFTWAGAIANLKKRKYLDKFITVAKSLGDSIAGVTSENKVIIPVGINLDRFAPRDSKLAKNQLKIPISNRPIIGAVSRLSKEKNLSYIIDLAAVMKDFDFIVVGEGNQRSELEKKISDNQLSNIKLIGFKQDVEKYYNVFDAFVLTSTIEGTPISILEAMASGIPVFSTMVGAIPDIITVNETGFKLMGNTKLDSRTIKTNLLNKEVINKAKSYVQQNHDVKKNSELFFKAIASMDNYFVEKTQQENLILLNGEYI